MTIAAAAAPFAKNLIVGRLTDWLTFKVKLRNARAHAREAFERAATATIDGCGLAERSPAWNEITTVLGDPERAAKVARLLRAPGADPDAAARKLGLKSPDAERVLMDFVGRLGDELTTLIPAEDQPAVVVILQAINSLHVAMQQRPQLTRFDARRRPTETVNWSDAVSLSAYARSIPTIGRAEAIASLRQWLDTASRISVRVITGDGGRGKTRLALELCEQVAEQGWAAGFLPSDELAHFPERASLYTWKWGRPTLIVIDYVAERASQIHEWLVALANHPAQTGNSLPSLRVLLIERSADPQGGWWTTAFGIGGGDADAVRALLDPPEPAEVPPISDYDEQAEIARHVLSRTAPSLHLEPAVKRALYVAREWGASGDPLTIMLAALAVAEHPAGESPGDRTTFARMLAQRERQRLADLALDRKASPAFLLQMAACVTLSHGLSASEAAAIARSEATDGGFHAVNVPDQLRVLADALPGRDFRAIDAIVPDLIGEAFLLEVWPNTTGCDAVLRCAAHVDASRVCATVIRTAQDYAGAGATEPLTWLEALAGGGHAMTVLGTLDEIAQETLALRETAHMITSAAVDQARHAAQHGPTVESRDTLAGLLNNFSNRLGALGRLEEALHAIEEAVAIRRNLVAARPDAFRPRLAMSLNNLANLLGDLGRHEEALAAAAEAVATHRDLVAAGLGAFRPALAMSLNNLANCLDDLGRREDALIVAREAVERYRDLAASHGGAFRPEFAGSLNNLVGSLGRLGRSEEALTASEEAVATYRDLAAARPDAFRPDLAMSLDNLSICLSGVGRREEALAAAVEAVAIHRGLAAARHGAFRPGFAGSLNNFANRLSDLGRREEALGAAVEAAAIYRDLTAARPDAFRPDLAMSLNNLAAHLSGVGRHEEALGAAKGAVAIYRDLTAARPSVFNANLVRSLLVLARSLRALGRVAEATAAEQEAAALAENNMGADGPG